MLMVFLQWHQMVIEKKMFMTNLACEIEMIICVSDFDRRGSRQNYSSLDKSRPTSLINYNLVMANIRREQFRSRLFLTLILI